MFSTCPPALRPAGLFSVSYLFAIKFPIMTHDVMRVNCIVRALS